MTICSSAKPAADIGAASRIGNSRIKFPGSSIRRIRIIRDCIYRGFPLAARSCRRDSFESEIQSDRYSTNRIGTICEQCFTFKKPDRGSRLLLHREFVEARKPLILICVKALELKAYKAK